MNIKCLKLFVLLFLFGSIAKYLSAFPDSSQHKVNATILLPLYLDSMFKYGAYKHGNSIPKFALSALEFYNGVQMAADSLNQEGILAKIEVVDSRKNDASRKLFANYNSNKPQLVIGVLQSASELKSISSLAQQHNTPLISATYPNDGGVTGNQNLLIVNSTLKTHCDGVVEFLKKNNATGNVLLISRQGNADDRVKNYLIDAEKALGNNGLKWRVVSVPDTVSAKQLSYYMDSTKQNIVVGASLDNDFALKLISNLSTLKTSYKSAIYGMPTWDELNLTKAEYKGVDVYFSTAFVSYSANADLYAAISRKFKKIANSKPSDMVFKGFELTYRYVKTLAKYPDSFIAHVNDPVGKVFADFNFQSVTVRNNNNEVDYLENKKVYFIKKTDGAVKGVY